MLGLSFPVRIHIKKTALIDFLKSFNGHIIYANDPNIETQKKHVERLQLRMAHAFNPSTPEAEAGRFLSSRPTWSTE